MTIQLERIAEAQQEVLNAWRLVPDSEATPQLMADIAVQTVIDVCIKKEVVQEQSVEH